MEETRRAGVELLVHLEIETGLSRGGFQPEAAARIARSIVDTARSQTGRSLDAPGHPGERTGHDGSGRQSSSGRRSYGEADLPVPPRHMARDRRPAHRSGSVIRGSPPGPGAVRPRARRSADRRHRRPIAADGCVPAMAIKCRPLRVETAAGRHQGRLRRSLAAERRVGRSPRCRSAMGMASCAPTRRAPRCSSTGRASRSSGQSRWMRDGRRDRCCRGGLDDEFVLLGAQDGARIATSELARLRTTIPWEVVTSMAHRVPRVYHAGSVLLGLRTLDGEARVTG